MSLIITHISRFGIIHTSDSNVSNGNNNEIIVGKKVFPIEYLNAGLAVSGTYSVDGVSLDIWMEKFIQDRKGIHSLKDFSSELRDQLQRNLRDYEFENGCIIHISGYSKTNDVIHPELWFIRNVHSINETTGKYENIDQNINLTEDYYSRDLLKHISLNDYNRKTFSIDYTYINGFTPGRVAYNILTYNLHSFFNDIWTKKDWKFKPPSSLDGYELLLKTYMTIIGTLFQLSPEYGNVIGGDPQFYKIDS